MFSATIVKDLIITTSSWTIIWVVETFEMMISHTFSERRIRRKEQALYLFLNTIFHKKMIQIRQMNDLMKEVKKEIYSKKKSIFWECKWFTRWSSQLGVFVLCDVGVFWYGGVT